MTPTKNKIYSPKALKALMLKWKSQGEKVVFTNGCFDILHLGHIDYLEKAKTVDHLFNSGYSGKRKRLRFKQHYWGRYRIGERWRSKNH